MFENIIGQETIVSELSREISAARLPASLLFYGPAYAGKLSVALETARVLTCDRGTALWNCSCRSCELQRLLLHPYTFLLGSRYFAEEISASGSVLLRTGKDFARYLFTRSVRKLLRRFDPFLWEGEESKVQKIQPFIEAVEDSLSLLAPGIELPVEKKLKKTVDGIIEDCRKIAGVQTSDNIPISQIRRAIYRVHFSSPGERKVLILERADRMQENSRNALLKLLEEPPAGLQIILLAERRSGIMPTILSRVRSCFFRGRDEKTSAEILGKIFREEPGGYGTLRRYFATHRGIDPARIEEAARRFIDAVLAGGTVALEEVTAPAGPLSDDEAFRYFLEELSALQRDILREGPAGGESGRVSVETLASWNALLREAYRQNEQLNIGASVLLSSLYYRMKGNA